MNFEDIQNKRVLLRCDFNEPVADSMISSHKRVDANISDIQELLARNNKVILLSHHTDRNQSMLPVYNYLSRTFTDLKYLDTTNVLAIEEYFSLNTSSNLVLIENTRMFYGLDKDKSLDELNDHGFSKFLSSLGDCFVFDCFSVGHRDHSSTTGIAAILPSCYGPTFLKEKRSLDKISEDLSKTLVFLGGAKLATKIEMLENFLQAGSTVCLGGAMVHPIIKSNGFDIKDSFLEDSEMKISDVIKNSNNLILPKYYIWDEYKKIIVDDLFDLQKIKQIIEDKKLTNILWNGPVGMYEKSETHGSIKVYNFIKDIDGMYKVVGGGDTITFLEAWDPEYEKYFSYVSLSGGAMLEYLTKKTLPILNIIKV